MAKYVQLNDESPAIIHLRRRDKRIARLIEMIGAFDYETYDDEYEFLIGSIIGQMISGAAAAKIGGRLKQVCENAVTLEAIDELADEDLRAVGLSRPKIGYIRALNDSIRNGELRFEDLREMSDEDATKKLVSLRGIGAWTATMYLIFVLDRQDVVSAYDRCFLEVYRWLYNTEDVSVPAIRARAKKWSPYASVVARYFYKALDRGLTKTKFKMK